MTLSVELEVDPVLVIGCCTKAGGLNGGLLVAANTTRGIVFVMVVVQFELKLRLTEEVGNDIE